jgi:serine/threonine protein phosphatase 1
MPGRTIAIGDIHGCSAALSAIIEAIGPTPDDTLVPLGDYVDRGPDSRGVLDQLLALESRCRLVPLLGNHEQMLLDALQNPYTLAPWLSVGGRATVQSYGGSLANMPEEHLDFIRRCRRYFETATHFFVHANYQYDAPLDEQPDDLLFWEHLHLQLPRPHDNGKIAVVGHTAQKTCEVFDAEHVLCLDTYCHGGGWLTAMEVNRGKVWQANLLGKLRERE